MTKVTAPDHEEQYNHDHSYRSSRDEGQGTADRRGRQRLIGVRSRDMMEEEADVGHLSAGAGGADNGSSSVPAIMEEVLLRRDEEEEEEVDLMREIESFMTGEGDGEDEDGGVEEGEGGGQGALLPAAAASPAKKLSDALNVAQDAAENGGGRREEEVEDVETMESLKRKLTDLERDRDQLAADLGEKDRELERLEKEAAAAKAAFRAKEETLELTKEEAEAKCARIKEETDAKIAELKKRFTAANKDKEAMVMKYAMGEREVIVQRKGKEEAERKLKAVTKEKEELANKVKAAAGDKAKVQMLADSRLQDINVLKKDIDRWKEEVKAQEAKVCVAAARLKTEADAHRETRDHLDKTIKHLTETRQEIEATRKECAEFMQRIKDDEAARQKQSKNVEIEQSAKLIIDAAAANELEALRVKYAKLIEENNSLSVKVQKMEKERLESETEVGKLKEQVAGQKQEISDLLAQVAEMESLRMRLQREEERCAERGAEAERLRAEAAELREDMAACRAKEAELLEFTQKLTDKNVTLQSDLASAEAKSSALETEHARLAGKVTELETTCSQTSVELEEEKKRRKLEVDLLARKLAEKSAQADSLTQQTLDSENEVKVLKRKNAASLRELTRELQNCKRQLDEHRQQAATIVPTVTATSPSVSRSSRASSNTSLNRLEPLQPGGGDNGLHHRSYSGSHLAPVQEPNGLPTTAFKATDKAVMPDSQVLVDKIIKLQRLMAKRQEKLDFMEEHIGTLLEEVKKKGKIIQHYVMKMEPGALVTSESDRNKPAMIGRALELEQDKERKLSDSGGIMASLYTSRPSDANMTLELSLEINRKLQAVLEDTLLKNITLKENINTLGNEIAKMSVAHMK